MTTPAEQEKEKHIRAAERDLDNAKRALYDAKRTMAPKDLAPFHDRVATARKTLEAVTTCQA